MSILASLHRAIPFCYCKMKLVPFIVRFCLMSFFFTHCISFFHFSKSDEVADSSGSKIARIDQSTIVEINKKPVPLDSINKGINSVSITTTSPTLDYRTGCENMVVNKTVKAKVVKLNRKTLALNLDKSFLKDELRSSCNSGEKVIT